ncbi:MAG: hypothetical protein H0X30_20425 [Anaerolineae bacterium]|nr:hypothetical protein [Anaerolineae bacterium]
MIQYLELRTDVNIAVTADGFTPKSFELQLTNANHKTLILATVHHVLAQTNFKPIVTLKLRPQYAGEYVPLSMLHAESTCTLFINFPAEEVSKATVLRSWFEPALQTSWRNVSIPDNQKVELAYQRTFTDKEFTRIKLGEIPVTMEDKWFCYFENDCLYWHRSWTGVGVFEVTIVPISDGAVVMKAIANNDPEFNNPRAISTDMLENLFNNLCAEAEKIFDI